MSTTTTTTTTKFGFAQYFKPTPQLFRRIGTAFLSVFGMAGMFTSMIDGDKRIIYALIIVGLAGKFLTSFFGDDMEPLVPTEELTSIIAVKKVETTETPTTPID